MKKNRSCKPVEISLFYGFGVVKAGLGLKKKLKKITAFKKNIYFCRPIRNALVA